MRLADYVWEKLTKCVKLRLTAIAYHRFMVGVKVHNLTFGAKPVIKGSLTICLL